MQKMTKVHFGWILILVSVFVICDGNVMLTKMRQKRDKKASTNNDVSNVGNILFGDDGLLTNLLSGIKPNKKREGSVDPQLQDVAGPRPTTRPPNFLDGMGVLLGNLIQKFDKARENNSHKSDKWSDLDISKMGLCTKLACLDMNKLIENFKASSLYRNLKTLGVLLQDKEGLKLLAKIMTDPELLKAAISGNNSVIAAAFLGVGGGGGGNDTTFLGNHTLFGNLTGVISPNSAKHVNATVIDYYNYDLLDILHHQSQKENVTGATKGPVDYPAFYYDHDPKG